MNGSIKNMLVGIFVLSAITVCVAAIMFLKPTVGDGKQTLYVRFSDIGNINVGTRVRFAGKPIGEVVGMEEINDAREQPTDELGRVYFYQLTLHIDSGIKVYNTDEISIQTSGLMGEKSISITPKAPPKGVKPRQIKDQPVYADSVDSIQNAMIDFSELASMMEETFRNINHWVKDHGEELATTVQIASATMGEIEQAVSTYNQTNLIHDVQKGVRELTTSLTQIQLAMQEMEETHTFKNLGCVVKSLKSACHSIDLVSDDIAQGKGTLGKLVVGDDLYLQTNSIMTKANNLMNDLNHYGLLFHLNKQWQRTRLQRVNLLNALETPQSFRTYFQTEVDDINSSMSRISMLINKAENAPQRELILNSPPFKRDFADLMKKANELSDNLKLYNQQLSEAIGQ